MERILVVEDEQGISSFVRLELEYEGYQPHVAEDGRIAWNLFQQEQWDLILLDIMIPGLNGLEVLRRIRKVSSVPVILLTARGDTLDRVTGLDAGADDYLAKPFAIEELLARIRSLLRRKQSWSAQEAGGVSAQEDGGGEQWQQALTFGPIVLTPRSCTVTLAGEELSLTKTEYQLLYCLMRHKNEALSREKIIDMVWGKDHYIDANSVDVYVRYLRSKLDRGGAAGAPKSESASGSHGNSFITTLRGIGYIMKEN